MKINCEFVINTILVIIIILMIVNICLNNRDNLENTSTVDSSLKSRVKDAGIIVFKSNNCGYCKNLIQDLEKNDLLEIVILKDITDPKCKQEFSKLNESSVPVIYSTKHDKKHVGYADINTIFSKMNI